MLIGQYYVLGNSIMGTGNIHTLLFASTQLKGHFKTFGVEVPTFFQYIRSFSSIIFRRPPR